MTDSAHPHPLLLDVNAAARALSIGRTLMWELVRSKQLQTIRIGKRVLIPTASLERFVANQIAADQAEPSA